MGDQVVYLNICPLKKKRFQEQWWKQPKNVLRRTKASGLESKQNIGRVNQKRGKK